MPDYKNMYFRLAAKIADVIELLIQMQQEGEEQYCADQPDGISFERIRAEQPDTKLNENDLGESHAHLSEIP